MELTLGQALQKAVEAHKAGQIQEADRLYTAILQAQPKHPDANHNMGLLAVGVGKLQESLPFFKTALEANPSIGHFWLSYIDALIKSDKVVDAKAVLAEAKGNGIKGEVLDQLEQKLNAQNGVTVNMGLDNSDHDQTRANILDSLKLDQALRLAKKKIKDESPGDANRIYDDILARFPKNKKAIDGIKSLSDGFIDKASKVQDPSQDQIQTLISLYQQGQLQQVLDSTNQLLKLFPNSLALYNIQGAAHAGLGQFDSAIDSYKQAIRIKPDYVEAYNNMGLALNDKGDVKAAIDSFKKAVKIKPDYAEAHNNMGTTLQSKGDRDSAIDSYKQALKIKPDYAEAHNNMGLALKDRDDLEGAIESYKQAIKIKPDYAESYNNMGLALNDKGDLEAAIDSFKKALKIKPDYAETYNNMGIALKNNGDLDAAIASYKKAIKINPEYADAYNNMGLALNDKGDSETAIDSYNEAIKIKPDYADAYHNMGVVLQNKGDSEAAIDSYNEAMKIKPNFSECHRNISSLIIYKEHDEHFVKMQSLYLDPSITDKQRCNLSFALSKASEDLNEIGHSFSYLKIGNELRKKILSYGIEQDETLFSQLKKSYPSIAKKSLQSPAKTSELKPIFILGMPRSGTTLVEQIVSSHSGVTGAGELNYAHRFGQSIAKGLIKPSTKIILDFRQRYIVALKKSSDGRSIVTDKMPHNFQYLGLIFSAFPDAKVVHVNRDPAATCWSNYKHYFATTGLGYCYDLADIVTYYGLYKDLMQFWQEHYGDRIYNLNYDNFTIDQDHQTRKLIQYLGLEWEDGCLSPQSNKRSVRTVSNQQVRQKLYQGSSLQWRKFEPYLNGAFDQLTGLE